MTRVITDRDPSVRPFFEPFTIPMRLGDPKVDLPLRPGAPYPDPHAAAVQKHGRAVCGFLTQYAARDPRRLLVVENAYYLRRHIGREPFTREWLQGFRHSFLICEPKVAALALSSELRLFGADFDESLLGYEVLFELWNYLRHDPPVVIDAQSVVRAPGETLSAYCRAVGLLDRLVDLPEPPPLHLPCDKNNPQPFINRRWSQMYSQLFEHALGSAPDAQRPTRSSNTDRFRTPRPRRPP